LRYENVKVEKEDGIALLYINRPEALNALNTKTLTEMKDALEEISKEEGIRVVIITGSGEKAFVAGADIKEMLDKSPLEMREFTILGHSVMKTLANMSKVTIAAVNGYALGGGCELALACDMRIASERARFGQPEVNLGIFPGFGGTQRLPRLIGKGKASELILTGDMIDGKEAERIGLVNKVVPSEKLLEEAKALGRKILSKGPIAVRLAKSSINKSLETNLETGLAYEIEAVSLTFSTEDKKEGMKAFLEKRQPKFKGK